MSQRSAGSCTRCTHIPWAWFRKNRTSCVIRAKGFTKDKQSSLPFYMWLRNLWMVPIGKQRNLGTIGEKLQRYSPANIGSKEKTDDITIRNQSFNLGSPVQLPSLEKFNNFCRRLCNLWSKCLKTRRFEYYCIRKERRYFSRPLWSDHLPP